METVSLQKMNRICNYGKIARFRNLEIDLLLTHGEVQAHLVLIEYDQ